MHFNASMRASNDIQSSLFLEHYNTGRDLRGEHLRSSNQYWHGNTGPHTARGYATPRVWVLEGQLEKWILKLLEMCFYIIHFKAHCVYTWNFESLISLCSRDISLEVTYLCARYLAYTDTGDTLLIRIQHSNHKRV